MSDGAAFLVTVCLFLAVVLLCVFIGVAAYSDGQLDAYRECGKIPAGRKRQA